MGLLFVFKESALWLLGVDNLFKERYPTENNVVLIYKIKCFLSSCFYLF
jgi:hypothetical protein